MLTLARRLPRARPALRALGSRSMSLKYSKDHEWIKMCELIYALNEGARCLRRPGDGTRARELKFYALI